MCAPSSSPWREPQSSAYHGHFQHPDFRYLMFDLDADAKRHV